VAETGKLNLNRQPVNDPSKPVSLIDIGFSNSRDSTDILFFQEIDDQGYTLYTDTETGEKSRVVSTISNIT